MNKYDIFISYRRDGGEHLAGRVKDALKNRGFAVFMDVEDLKSGKFDNALLGIIENATDVVVILTPGCLDRCKNKDDWFRIEIRHAIECKLNIVPIIARGFQMPPPKTIPSDIAELPRYNGLVPAPELFEASIDRLISTFLKSSVNAAIPSPLPRMRYSTLVNEELNGNTKSKLTSWKKALNGPNPRMRDDAARSLIQAGETETVIESLSNKLIEIRMTAASALCELKVLSALPFLVSGLRNEGRKRQGEIIPGVETIVGIFGINAVEAIRAEMLGGVPPEERHRFVTALINSLDRQSLSDLLRKDKGLCDITLTEAALKSGLPLKRENIEPYLKKIGRYGKNNEHFDDYFSAKASEWILESSIIGESWVHDYVRTWLRLACVDGDFVFLRDSLEQMLLGRSALQMNAVDSNGLLSLALEVENLEKPGDKQQVAANLRKIAEGKW